MYIKRWCVLLTTSSPSCLRTVCGWGDGPSCLGRNSAVLSFASLLSISRFRVCHLRLSHHQHGLLHGVRPFLPKGSWDVSFPWLSYSRTLIIFGWLLFLNSSFKCSHFSRTCPQPLSRYPWVIPYTPATSHRQGGSSQISVSLLRSNTVFPSPHLLPCDINRIRPISNQKHYSFSFTSLRLFYLLGPLACKPVFKGEVIEWFSTSFHPSHALNIEPSFADSAFPNTVLCSSQVCCLILALILSHLEIYSNLDSFSSNLSSFSTFSKHSSDNEMIWPTFLYLKFFAIWSPRTP